VLALDPAGDLWLAPYRPDDADTYGGLSIWRLSGGNFSRELVRPGIWPQAMQMYAAGEGYIAGNHGRLLHRKDGRWRREDLEGGPGRWQDHNFLAIRLEPDGSGWACGIPGLLVRREAGGVFRPWPLPPELQGSILSALDVDPEGNLFVATQAGEIARFDGQAWQIDKPADGGILGIDLVGTGDGWAVGVRGLILRWDGRGWRRQASPTAANLFDVAMASPDSGYIAGAGWMLEAAAAPPLFEESEDRERFPLLDRPAMLAAGGDLDRDGDLDLVLASAAGAFLFERRGGGFAAGRQLPFAAPTAAAHLWDLVIGESNGDGLPDLLASFAPPALSLLEQLPGGGFAERKAAAGLDQVDPALHGSNTFVDLDGDGDLDLYLQRSVDQEGQLPKDLALENDGAGRFTPWPSEAGGAAVEIFALFGDLDGDRRPEVVLPDFVGRRTLAWRNRETASGGLFAALAAGGLAELPPGLYQQGQLADLDRDGRLDLLLFGERGLLLPGDGRGGFLPPRQPFAPTAPVNRQGPQLGAIGDLDLDGETEVLVVRSQGEGARLRVERRGEGGRYADVAGAWGLADLQADAALPADLDGDGDLDLVLAAATGTRIFLNRRERLAPPPAVLAVELRGAPSNPQAIGAELRLFSEEGGARGRLLQRVVSGLGDAPRGRRPAGRLLLALPAAGQAASGIRLEVDFPGGRQRVFSGLDKGGAAVVAEELEAGRAANGGLEERAGLAPALLFLAAVLLLAAGLARRRGQGGTTIGPYGDARFLAGGSVGEVYRARDAGGRPVALKVLHSHLARDGEIRARFEREAELLQRLDSPHLLRGRGRGVFRGRPYLVAELLEGRTLHALLASEGGQPRAALAITAEVAAALEYLHQRGLFHRDVKSDNVFVLDRPGPGWAGRVKLLDLGLAHGRALASLTENGAAVGTLAYLSPEQLQGLPADARTDLWALGLLLAEVHHGLRPTLSAEGYLGGFLTSPGRAPSAQRLAELFPGAWLPLLNGLLAADPGERFADAAAARAAIAELREQLE
jgi:hypothetical protein